MNSRNPELTSREGWLTESGKILLPTWKASVVLLSGLYGCEMTEVTRTLVAPAGVATKASERCTVGTLGPWRHRRPSGRINFQGSNTQHLVSSTRWRVIFGLELKYVGILQQHQIVWPLCFLSVVRSVLATIVGLFSCAEGF